MKDEGSLTILNEKFSKEGCDSEVDGLTIIVDGVIKKTFDIIKTKRNYDSYNEVLRDIIFEGVNSIITGI